MKKIQGIIEAINWSMLGAIGRSKAATISILIPFVGYLIIYHNAITPYLGGLGGALDAEGDECCKAYFSFETKLHLIYLGAICIGVGTIFYRIFAHKLIKKYSDVNDYIHSELDFLSSECIRNIFSEIREVKSTNSEEFLKIAPWLCSDKVGRKSASDAYNSNKEASIIIDVLKSYYLYIDNERNKAFIYVTAILYAIGLILISLPGIFFIYRVLCTLVVG